MLITFFFRSRITCVQESVNLSKVVSNITTSFLDDHLIFNPAQLNATFSCQACKYVMAVIIPIHIRYVTLDMAFWYLCTNMKVRFLSPLVYVGKQSRSYSCKMNLDSTIVPLSALLLHGCKISQETANVRLDPSSYGFGISLRTHTSVSYGNRY